MYKYVIAFCTLSTCSITYNISTINTTQTQVLQIPLHLATPQFNTNFSANKLPSSLCQSLPSNIFIDTPTTRDRVARYSNNSSDIFQSEVMFEKLKVTKLEKVIYRTIKS